MKIKRFTLVTLVLAMMALFAGMVVNAQDEETTPGKRGFGPRFGGNSEIILEATGLTQEELWQALQDGATLAELIEANDGDVDAVIGQLVEAATEHINEHVEEGRLTQEQADIIIAGLEERFTDHLNGVFEPRERFEGRGRRGGPRGGRGFGFGYDLDSSDDTPAAEETVTPEDA